MANPRKVALYAIFHRHVKGDHALLSLAQRRFTEAGLGAELHPGSPEELSAKLRFLPTHPDSNGYFVHLPRSLKLLADSDNQEVLDRIRAFLVPSANKNNGNNGNSALQDQESSGSRCMGLVVHDQSEVETHFDAYVAAGRALDAGLQQLGPGPPVFIEYASGVTTGRFVELHRALADCPRVSACIDISHIGLRHCQMSFRQRHPALEVCDLKSDHPDLGRYIEEVQEICHSAIDSVLEVLEGVAELGKPLHLHLHDSHPSSTVSPFGVSDHLSFFQEVAIPFSYRGRHALTSLFGPLGLQRIIARVRALMPEEQLSMTLEMHPTSQRQVLGQYEDLFWHWRDRTNAERMQHWIEELLHNHQLLRRCCECEYS